MRISDDCRRLGTACMVAFVCGMFGLYAADLGPEHTYQKCAGRAGRPRALGSRPPHAHARRDQTLRTGEEEEDDSPEAAARAMEERAPKKLRYCPLSRLFDPATWAAVHAARRFGVPSLFYALAGACRHRLHPRARASVRVCARGRQRG